jgi:hypothetical protein
MHSVIRPNAWVALKLPSGSTKVLQITPNTYVFFCLRKRGKVTRVRCQVLAC